VLDTFGGRNPARRVIAATMVAARIVVFMEFAMIVS
jgi:hypothetical protein